MSEQRKTTKNNEFMLIYGEKAFQSKFILKTAQDYI